MRGAMVCGGGQEGLRSAMVGADTWVLLLVGPWQYQWCTWEGAGWVPGIAPTQPPVYPNPGYPPTARMLPPTSTSRLARTGGLRSTKEILGVDNAVLVHRGTPWLCRHCRHLTPWLYGPSPGAYSPVYLSILSISQYFSDIPVLRDIRTQGYPYSRIPVLKDTRILSISQYFSVILLAPL